MDKLTDKQRLFCEKYILFSNATKAAKEAGYSEESARQIGSENLSKPYIKDYIEEKQKKIEELAEISRLMQIKKLIDIAYHDKKETTSNKLKAIEIINKMLGYNEAEKLNLSGNLQQNIINLGEGVKPEE